MIPTRFVATMIVILAATPFALGDEFSDAQLDAIRQMAIPIPGPVDDPALDVAALEPVLSQLRATDMLLFSDSGRADHGGTYAVLSRLIRGLHVSAQPVPERRLPVVVWPIGIFEADQVNTALEAQAPHTEVTAPLFSVWRTCAEWQPLFDAARRSWTTPNTEAPRPMRMAGTLCQYHRHAKDSYAAHLAGLLDAVPDVPGRSSIDDALETFGASLNAKPRLRDASTTERERARAALQRLRTAVTIYEDQLSTAIGTDRLALEQRMMDAFDQFLKLETQRAGGASAMVNEMRLRAQSNILLWHMGRERSNAQLVMLPGHDGCLPTITHEDRPFTVAVTYHHGTARRADRPDGRIRTLPTAKNGTIESLLAAAGIDTAYVDLRGMRDDPSHPLYGMAIGRPDRGRNVPAIKLDALIFINEMTPCTPLAAE